MEASYKIRFSEEHLLAALSKYHEQIWWRRPFTRHRWLIIVASAIALAFCVYSGVVIGAAIAGAILGALLVDWPINAWLFRKRFRKSPYHDDDASITLSDEGFRAVGRSTDMSVQWRTYTKARRFSDGLLLFQGPHLFNWLPDEAASEPSMVGVAEKLVQERVSDYRSA